MQQDAPKVRTIHRHSCLDVHHGKCQFRSNSHANLSLDSRRRQRGQGGGGGVAALGGSHYDRRQVQTHFPFRFS